jgi:hypothetical protein
MQPVNFEEICVRLKGAADLQRGADLSPELRAILLEIDDAVSGAGVEVFRRACDAVALTVAETSSPTAAGLLAVWIGASVEDGADPEATCEPILETFLKWSQTLETPPEDDEGEDEGGEDEESVVPEPDAETVLGLQFLGQALVAHLARAPDKRRWAAETPEIFDEFERIDFLSVGASWVLHLLKQRSGDLLVFDVIQEKGFLVRYENLTNCFHLFTLLQGALAGLAAGAETPDERVLDIARGAEFGDGHDHAWWHFGQGDVPTAKIGASVWGEAGPEEIACVDGMQALLLWPPILESRSWDAGFFSPILYASMPSVTLTKELSPAENHAWRARLGLEGAPF